MPENRGRLWGSGEICAALSISRKVLRDARTRGGFPEPLDTINAGRTDVWDPVEVRAWAAERQAARDARAERRLEALREYRRTGTIAAAAQLVGVHADTVREWLRTAGEPLPRDDSPPS